MEVFVDLKAKKTLSGFGSCLRLQQVKVHLTKGIIDLNDYANQVIILIKKIEETDRVEDIIEIACSGHHDGFSQRLCQSGLLENCFKFFLDWFEPWYQVVAIMDCHRTELVVAEKQTAFCNLRQFIQLERVEINRIPKTVSDWHQPGMHDFTEIDF